MPLDAVNVAGKIMKTLGVFLAGALLAVTIAPAYAGEEYQFERVVSGLDEPWAFGFLPGGEILVTERDGRLLLIREGRARSLPGGPEVEETGQGGLLDVLVPRDFARSRQIYLTYAKRQKQGGAGTALFRARLPEGALGLTGGETLFEMTGGNSGGRHFGSRIVEAPDGSLFMTIGERGDRKSAQDLARHNGSVLRLTREGKPVPDNPFVGQTGKQPEIWSYGHRNPQGLAVDASGALWVSEHGARGGDEINKLARGGNYGWPVIAYGRHYSGLKIGEGTHKAGMEQPEFYWDPSIAPSGLVFHDGRRRSDWKGDALVGSLKFDYIARLSGTPLREVEKIQTPETERVRDVRQGPDGHVWFLSVGQGALYRMLE